MLVIPQRFGALVIPRGRGGGAVPFTTEWKSAGAGASDNSAGGTAWTNPGNITASDDNRAVSSSGGSTPFTTQILRASNFGFTTDDIPPGAIILGIEVEIERRRAMPGSASVTDNLVRLRTASGQVGDNKASASVWPPGDGDDGTETYGGAEDDWNAGLSDSDIRTSDFGVDLRADCAHGYAGFGAAVDHIRIRVHGVA